MILLLTSHQGVTQNFVDMLLSYGLPVHDAQVFSADEAIAICNREDRPTCLLVVENGFDLHEQSHNGRYRIVDKLQQHAQDIPVVFCTQEADAKFYEWAKERTQVILTGKVAPDRLASVLDKILKGETPSTEEPVFFNPVVREEDSGRLSIRDRFFGRKAKPKEPEQSVFRGREGSQDDREILPLDVSAGEQTIMFQDPIAPPEEALTPVVMPEPSGAEAPQAHNAESNSDILIAISEAAELERRSISQLQTATVGEQKIPAQTKQTSFIGSLTQAVANLSTIAFTKSNDRPSREPGLGPDIEEPQLARNTNGESRSGGSFTETVQIVEKPAHQFAFPEQDVIGVFALTRGAGATYTALRIAQFLAKHGQTALVAYDGRDDLEFAGIGDKSIYICFPNENERTSTVPILRREHRFIVLDFGTPLDVSNFGMFTHDDSVKTRQILGDLMNCNRRVCLNFSAPWHDGRQRFLTYAKIEHNCLLLTEKQRDMGVDELMGKIYPGPRSSRGLAGLLRSR